MNWALFSLSGYISVGLWLSMPLLWAVHEWRRPRKWWCHVALIVGIGAYVLATIHSQTHISRIQVDHSQQVDDQMSQQQLARQAAQEQRAGEVAQIRFAEDAAGEFLDKGGLDDADRAYLESLESTAQPAWKAQKKDRTDDGGADAGDLQSMIGGSQKESEGMESQSIAAEPTVEPILMSEKDKLAADRLDGLNLSMIRIMLLLGAGYVLFDYVRRLNHAGDVYLPLPLPSRWTDAITPRAAVEMHDLESGRSLGEMLRLIARRGEVFLLLTDDSRCGAEAGESLARLPWGLWPMKVLRASEQSGLSDEFVFETLWFGRNCIVVEQADRAVRLLEDVVDRLAQRRVTRARSKQRVHVIWCMERSIDAQTQRRFAQLGAAAGFGLMIWSKTALIENGPHDEKK